MRQEYGGSFLTEKFFVDLRYAYVAICFSEKGLVDKNNQSFVLSRMQERNKRVGAGRGTRNARIGKPGPSRVQSGWTESDNQNIPSSHYAPPHKQTPTQPKQSVPANASATPIEYKSTRTSGHHNKQIVLQPGLVSLCCELHIDL